MWDFPLAFCETKGALAVQVATAFMEGGGERGSSGPYASLDELCIPFLAIHWMQLSIALGCVLFWDQLVSTCTVNDSYNEACIDP